MVGQAKIISSGGLCMDRREYQIFGPPGTGKTTYLANQIKLAAEKFGPQAVLVASFTRAAATEITSRGLPVDRMNVGTLHAICYRALGSPRVAAEFIDDWNRENETWALSGGSVSLDDPDEFVGSTDGDQLLSALSVLRAKMVDPALYPNSVANFAARWSAWKKENNLVDYTDMIDLAYRNIEMPPGYPTVGFFDEVQDFTPLELALIRLWAAHMHSVVLAGDDDQSVYAFKGADPEAFFKHPVPEENKRVLAQSYRVPRLVQTEADRWVQRLSSRVAKEYFPRDADGRVVRLGDGSYLNPEPLLRHIDGYLAAGKRVMILGACAYMLDPIKRVFRDRGYPYHNPYRRKRPDWNPLFNKQASSGGLSTADRLLAYLLPSVHYFGDQSRMWYPADLQKWVSLLAVKGVLQPGHKILLEEMGLADGDPLSSDQLLSLFTPGGLRGAYSVDPDWLLSSAASAKKKSLEYPVRVLKKFGVPALANDPLITIGTIHSVKGGEADVVFLFPDISFAGMQGWQAGGTADRDSLIRQFYVGMTRAREDLVLCSPAGPCHIRL